MNHFLIKIYNNMKVNMIKKRKDILIFRIDLLFLYFII